MKLFANFYACLALILLIALCSVEARGSMGGGRGKVGMGEEPDVPKDLVGVVPEEARAKRELPKMDEPPKDVPEQFKEGAEKARYSRQAPPMPPMPNDMPLPGK